MALKLDKTKMVRSLVRKNKLVYHLDRAIGEGDFKWHFDYEPKQEDTGWHPSSHCTPSSVELYHYALDNTPQDHLPDGSAPIQKNRTEGFTPALYKTFMVGHFWHQYLQWILVHKLNYAKPEAIERRGTRGWGDNVMSGNVHHYRDWHYATGSGDAAPVYIPTHGAYLLDFKTMGAHAYKPNMPPGDTLKKWECQVNIYMDFFDLERAMVVAILKDSPHDMKEFVFHRNQPLVDQIYGKWECVSQALEEGVEPEDEVEELPLEGPVDE